MAHALSIELSTNPGSDVQQAARKRCEVTWHFCWKHHPQRDTLGSCGRKLQRREVSFYKPCLSCLGFIHELRHSVSLAYVAEHGHWKSLGVGVQAGSSPDLHTSSWMTWMSWACLAESQFPQLQNEGMNAHLGPGVRKKVQGHSLNHKHGVNTYMYQVLDKELKQKSVLGGSSGICESFGAAMAGFLSVHQESIPICPC